MVMKAYDLRTYGRYSGYDNTSSASVVVLTERKVLSNVESQRGPAPYTAFRPQYFLKRSVRKLNGWSDYREYLPKGYYIHWSGPSVDFSSQMVFDPLSGQRGDALTDSYNKAVNQINDKVRGNTDLSVDLLQGSKTLRIGQDCAKVVSSLLKARNPVNIIKAVGSARLTWAYGIKPTLSSIYDAVHFSAKHYNNEFSFSTGRGSSAFRGSAGNSGQQWPDNTYTNRWEGEGLSRVQLGIVLRIPDTPATQVARLSSLNPVSMAWELVPFSFVVDWFVNIGGYLRDLETALAYNSYFVRGYRTNTTLTKYTLTAHRYIVGPTQGWTGDWGLLMMRTEKQRTVLSSYPMPARPVFHANLGSGRLLNTAALLSNFLGPKRRGISASGGGSAIQRAKLGFGG